MYGRVLSSGLSSSYNHLKKFLLKKFFPQKYVFNSKSFNNQLGYWSVPRQSWSAGNQRQAYIVPIFCLGLFLIGYGTADLVYSLRNNQKQSYRLYTMYPKMCKIIDDLFQSQQTKDWVDLLQKCRVKDKIQFYAFWDKVHKLIWEEQEKEKMKVKDQKVLKLRQEFEEVDAKYGLPNAEEKESVF